MADNNVIHFNKNDYDHLIQVVTGDQTDLENKFLKAGPYMMLDDTLGDFVKPGVDTWGPAKAVKDGAKNFGGSVSEKFGKVDDEWIQFLKDLKDVSDVFTNCNDLATMSAQDFRDKYPDFGGGGWGGGGNGNTA